MDLYEPTLKGLEFFYPKLVKGGVILVHDYFKGFLPHPLGEFLGIRKAVSEFAAKFNVSYMPIGDAMSVAFIKD